MRRLISALCLLLCITAQPAHAMGIAVEGSDVVMFGGVRGNECQQLRDILDHGNITRVILGDSDGGDARTGYCVGELIRQRHLPTMIRGSCVSSCSRMWLGGVPRTLDGPKSRVGLHANYDTAGNIKPESTGQLRAWLPRYAPNIDRTLMNEWTVLPHNHNMYFFYNDHAEKCDRRDCTDLPGRNVSNAGLLPP